MPVAATGQTIPWSDHGTLHYITAKEHNVLNLTMLFCLGMFAVVAVGVYLEIQKISSTNNKWHR